MDGVADPSSYECEDKVEKDNIFINNLLKIVIFFELPNALYYND